MYVIFNNDAIVYKQCPVSNDFMNVCWDIRLILFITVPSVILPVISLSKPTSHYYKLWLLQLPYFQWSHCPIAPSDYRLQTNINQLVLHPSFQCLCSRSLFSLLSRQLTHPMHNNFNPRRIQLYICVGFLSDVLVTPQGSSRRVFQSAHSWTDLQFDWFSKGTLWLHQVRPKDLERSGNYYYYYIYSYFKYTNPTQVICKQTWQNLHKTQKVHIIRMCTGNQ